MTKVFSALAVSVDGYITGPHPSPEQPLGVGGARLFDWYTDVDTPSRIFDGFRLWPASAAVFDAAAERVGAVVSGRKTYDDSRGWHGGGATPNCAAVRAVSPAAARAAGQLGWAGLHHHRDH
jgi:hypothetical protein